MPWQLEVARDPLLVGVIPGQPLLIRFLGRRNTLEKMSGMAVVSDLLGQMASARAGPKGSYQIPCQVLRLVVLHEVNEYSQYQVRRPPASFYSGSSSSDGIGDIPGQIPLRIRHQSRGSMPGRTP